MIKKLKTLNLSGKAIERKTAQQVEQSMREFLTQCLVQLYGSSDEREYQQVLDHLNQDYNSSQTAVCAKQLSAGDVAWRCLDCEKDPTCIICKECFEKGDHEGHNVQLKRNVTGCCDCGDPHAWDSNHFCPDHQGFDVDPEAILEKLPNQIRRSAESVFDKVSLELKKQCMSLQNFSDQCGQIGMSDEKFKITQISCILFIMEFMFQRIEECPSFLHILALSLNRVYMEPKILIKNDDHKKCCVRVFPPDSEEEIALFEEHFKKHENYKNMCSCTPLDLCMQTNCMLSDEARQLQSELIYKLFQSYRFKQYLILSFTANYSTLFSIKGEESEHDISTLGVQVLTSDEMSILVFKNPDLRNNLLTQLYCQIRDYKAAPDDEGIYLQFFKIMHDLKYIARPQSVLYCIENTDFVERFIKILSHFYFIDTKKKRQSMIEFMEDGEVSENLLNLESFLIKVGITYLKDVPAVSPKKNRSILLAFKECFNEINQTIDRKKLQGLGFYNLPAHRLFAFYLVRLLVFQKFSKEKQVQVHGNNWMSIHGFRAILQESLSASGAQKKQKTEHSVDDPDKNQQSSEHDKLMKSSLAEEEPQPSSLVECEDPLLENVDQIIDDLIRNALLPLVKANSFVHEIEARKWVYHGIHLEDYPQLYYRILSDEYFLQDVGLAQILICCEDEAKRSNPYQRHYSVIEYFIDNAGLDKELQTLFKGVLQRKLVLKDFTKASPQFDIDKLRMSLTCFMRYLVYLCLCEISFTKQIYSRKDHKADNQTNKNNAFLEQARQLWKCSLKKEAAHLLMLHKVNTPISELKKGMPSCLQKDQAFQDILFEVSDQARDTNNQVTFRLKPEYFPWFDPFHYGIPEQHSQSYQMYETNQYKDKYLEEGLNDIVGDYKGNYKCATGINYQIMDAISTSKLVGIVCSLLSIWLKYRKRGDSERSGKGKKQEQASNRGGIQGLLQNIQENLSQQRQGRSISDFYAQLLQNQFQDFNKSSPKSDFTDQEKKSNVDFNEDLVAKLVDNTVGHYCLKLFTIFVNCFTRSQDTPAPGQISPSSYINHNYRMKFIVEISQRQFELVTQLTSYWVDLKAATYADSQNTEPVPCTSDHKALKLVTHLLSSIYTLDSETFVFVGQTIGLVSGAQTTDPLSTDFSPDNKLVSDTQKKVGESGMDAKGKKEKMKKMQAKLMKKMKNNASKFLEKREDITGGVAQDDENNVSSSEQQIQCAFCQEVLQKQNYLTSPFGNFAYVQSTKLLHHSIEQTLSGQTQALSNADLSQQFQMNDLQNTSLGQIQSPKQATKGLTVHQEVQIIEQENFSMKTDPYDEQQIDSSSTITDFKLKKSALSYLVCNSSQTPFLNEYTGSGAVITRCQHFSHLQCLEKYKLHQTVQGEEYQQFLFGFKAAEHFACPICKCLQNSLIPTYSLEDFEDIIHPETGVQHDKHGMIMHFYMDYISKVIMKQQGFVCKRNLTDAQFDKLKRTILLVDAKEQPDRLIQNISGYFLHRISLIDIKGLQDFQKTQASLNLSILHSSLRSLLKILLEQDQNLASLPIVLEDLLSKEIAQIFEQKVQPVAFLAQNQVARLMKLLFITLLGFGKTQKEDADKMIDHLIHCFYPILKLQFIIAALFRKNNGKLSGSPDQIKSHFTLEMIKEFYQQISQNQESEDMLIQVELPVMRKVLAAVYSLKYGEKANIVDKNDVLQEICAQSNDKDELEAILKFLKLQEMRDSYSNSLGKDGEFNSEIDVSIPHLKEVSQKIQIISQGQYIEKVLSQFGDYLQVNANKSKHVREIAANQDLFIAQIPVNLLLMTPYFEFNLFEMPINFKNLQRQFYKQKCAYCSRVVIENATCLLSGRTMCWFKMRSASNLSQCRVGSVCQQAKNEGLISWHSRVQEGGLSILMQTSSGRIALTCDGVSCFLQTPYRNRFGEEASEQSKNQEDFVIDQQGGGMDALVKLRNGYLNFSLANDILQQRTNPDTKFRVYLANNF